MILLFYKFQEKSQSGNLFVFKSVRRLSGKNYSMSIYDKVRTSFMSLLVLVNLEMNLDCRGSVNGFINALPVKSEEKNFSIARK